MVSINIDSLPGVKHPMNGALRDNVLVVPDELDLLPHIAEEAVHIALHQIVGAVEPVWGQNADLKLNRRAVPR